MDKRFRVLYQSEWFISQEISILFGVQVLHEEAMLKILHHTMLFYWLIESGFITIEMKDFFIAHACEHSDVFSVTLSL